MMRVTDKGIDWSRVRPEDFERVAAPVVEASHRCSCGREQRRGAHFRDGLGRLVCPTSAWFALRDVERAWNSPLAQALPKTPRVEQLNPVRTCAGCGRETLVSAREQVMADSPVCVECQYGITVVGA